MKKNKKVNESRVERNTPKNRRKRKVKKVVKKIVKIILKNLGYVIVGIAYASYLLIRAFDNLIAKLFMKLPRVSRAIIIWALVISNLNYNFDFKSMLKNETVKPQIITSKQTPQENASTSEITPQNETKQQEEEYKCTLGHETACKIKKKAEEYNIDWKVAVSISAWETGHWKSSLYYNKNNIGGMYCNGGFISYNTLDEGIEAFVSNLKRNYFDIGLNTLESIKPKYCPDNAANDPTGLNKHWLNGVKGIYQSLEG